jgi:antitoxin component of MazEF toxin-antitoxin module
MNIPKFFAKQLNINKEDRVKVVLDLKTNELIVKRVEDGKDD